MRVKFSMIVNNLASVKLRASSSDRDIILMMGHQRLSECPPPPQHAHISPNPSHTEEDALGGTRGIRMLRDLYMEGARRKSFRFLNNEVPASV